MGLAEGILPEFDHEMTGVRRTLERIPEDKFDWRPHAKSGTLGWLAAHVATLPGLPVSVFGSDSYEVAPVGKIASPPKLNTRQEVLSKFDETRDAGRAAIAGASDQQMEGSWTLLFQGNKVFTMPRKDVLRRAFINHIIHHRAQLGVYLRLNGVPVPSLYGPSADEQI